MKRRRKGKIAVTSEGIREEGNTRLERRVQGQHEVGVGERMGWGRGIRVETCKWGKLLPRRWKP